MQKVPLSRDASRTHIDAFIMPFGAISPGLLAHQRKCLLFEVQDAPTPLRQTPERLKRQTAFDDNSYHNNNTRKSGLLAIQLANEENAHMRDSHDSHNSGIDRLIDYIAGWPVRYAQCKCTF